MTAPPDTATFLFNLPSYQGISASIAGGRRQIIIEAGSPWLVVKRIPCLES